MNRPQRIALFAIAILFLAGGIFMLARYWSKQPVVEPSSGDRAAARVRQSSPPGLIVEAHYPGANAEVVRDTVAAPIEQQVNGVEDMISMTSRSGSDGTYVLNITFRRDVDLDKAQMLVQNRVSLAMSVLPDIVNRATTIKKLSPGLLLFVCISSPQGRFDAAYLGNYATIQIKDELARVAGVGEVTMIGQHDNRLQIHFDSAKLAGFDLTSDEAIKAIEAQNLQVGAGQIGQPPVPNGQHFQVTVTTLGRLIEPDQVGDIVIKTKEGTPIRLKDVARVETGTHAESYASIDGIPAVFLGVFLQAKASSSATRTALMERLRGISAQLPEGLALNIVFDFSTNLDTLADTAVPEYLRLDLRLPDLASMERTLETARQCEKLLRELVGVQHVAILCGRPFTDRENEARILIELEPAAKRNSARDKIVETIRDQTRRQILGAMARVSDLTGARSFPEPDHLIDLAIVGGEGSDARDAAEQFAEQLRRDGKLVDVWISSGGAQEPRLVIEIDRQQAAALGVQQTEIINTLETYLGSVYTNGGNRFGRTWSLTVKGGDKFRMKTDDIKMVQVRNDQNQMIKLGTLVSIRGEYGAAVIERMNMYPMVRITADLAPDVSEANARALCEGLAKRVLPKQCRLEWLSR